MIDKLREIYSKMGDELSKQLFLLRLNHSISGSDSYIENIVDITVRSNRDWKDFLDVMNKFSGSMVLFGDGIWGRILQSELKNIHWKAIIDNSLKHEGKGEVPVIYASDYLSNYHGEKIVISSYKNREEMVTQCLEAGVPESNIIDAANVIYKLTEGMIYFDRDISINPCNGLFIDGGCYDGSDTLRYLEKYNGRALCFEPDEKNIEKIHTRLSNLAFGKYQIVAKALWNSETEVEFADDGNFGSHIAVKSEGVTRIQAGTIDAEAGEETVSMIKMDIEGSELEALKGAKNVIGRDHPILAISVYHRPSDIVEIPNCILRLYGGYRMYLRHYSFSWYDTVLYAVPEES